jgi:hypothetical protein
MEMSGKRVYGTAVHAGLRHIATGVVDGTFAKTKGGWDTNTYCGQYVGAAVEEDDSLVVTCLRCLGRRPNTGSILRGEKFDSVEIDEPLHYIKNDVVIDEAMNLSSEDVKNVLELYDHGVLSRSYVAGTLSAPPPPSDEEPPT